MHYYVYECIKGLLYYCAYHTGLIIFLMANHQRVTYTLLLKQHILERKVTDQTQNIYLYTFLQLKSIPVK